MLRLACILGVEAGVKICAPVHDALLIEAPSEAIAEQVRSMQRVMAEASAYVLGGFELRSDVKIISSPERYSDPRGTVMWERVEELLSTKHPVPPALSPTSDRPVNHPPDRPNLQTTQPVVDGHDGTPSLRGGVPPWDIPCPAASHPLRIII